MLRRLPSAALLSCVAALAACGGGGGDSSPTPPDNGQDNGQAEPIPTTFAIRLTIAEGAGAGAGGSVSVVVGSSAAQTVSAGVGLSIDFSSGTDVRLLAVPNGGYAFSGWTLTGGLSCEGGLLRDLACELDVDLAAAGDSPSIGAAFATVATTLVVSVAGDGGSVEAVVAGDALVTVGVSGQGFSFSVEATATLTAEPDPGYRFAGWTGACGRAGMEVSCVLNAGRVGDAEVGAAFDLVATTLTVSAGDGGSVETVVRGADAMTVGAGMSDSFAFDVESTATLTAVPAGGYVFAGWALSPGGLSCPDAECAVPDGTLGPVAATATFTAFLSGLLVSVAGPGAAGGSVAVDFGDGFPTGEASHRDAFSTSTVVTELASVMLEAEWADGYAFSGWRLSVGLSCDGGGLADNRCTLVADLDAFSDPATVVAAFELVATTLTVSAGADGSVAAVVRGADAMTVGAGESDSFAFDVESTATLTAVPAGGYAFDGWALSPGGLSCPDAECAVPDGTIGLVAATATFTVATAMLAVSVAGPGAAGGSVAVDFGDGSPQGMASQDDAFSTPTVVVDLPEVMLTATAAAGYAFSDWTPTGGLSCEAETDTNVCELDVDLAAAAAGSPSVVAAFGLVATTLTVSAGAGGSVAAVVRGADAMTVGAGESDSFAFDVESTATLTAVPAGGYAFDGWALSPDGLSCPDVECAVPDETLDPVAATATFTVVTAMLAVSVAGPGAAGGSVAVDFGDGSPQGMASQDDAFSTPTVVVDLPEVMLTATAAAGYAFSGWTPTGGLSCEARTDTNVCELDVDLAAAAAGSPSVVAAFGLVATTLTVSAGADGSVAAVVRGADAMTVGAGRVRQLRLRRRVHGHADGRPGRRLRVRRLGAVAGRAVVPGRRMRGARRDDRPGGRHGHLLQGRPGHADGERRRRRLGGGRLPWRRHADGRRRTRGVRLQCQVHGHADGGGGARSRLRVLRLDAVAGRPVLRGRAGCQPMRAGARLGRRRRRRLGQGRLSGTRMGGPGLGVGVR